MAVLSIEDLESEAILRQAKGIVEAERQCRISLAATWPRAVPLDWNAGGPNGRRTVIPLEPGKSVVQPLPKAQVWFGPFAIPMEFATADERRKDHLRKFWADEKARYLNRFGYPHKKSGYHPDMTPIGPHLSPDVTITILEADGSESDPIRLYELYKIGEFDPLKDEFGIHETADQVEERYKAELAAVSDRYERDQAEMKTKMAEMAGMLQGFMAKQPEAKAKNG